MKKITEENIEQLISEKLAQDPHAKIERIGDKSIVTYYSPLNKQGREIAVETFLKAEAISKKQSNRASVPCTKVTKAQLEVFRAAFEAEHGRTFGWVTGACKNFSTTKDTIRRILSGN